VIGDGRFTPRVQRALYDVPIAKPRSECDAGGGRSVVVAEADSNAVAAECFAQNRRQIRVVPFSPLDRRLLGNGGFRAALTELGGLVRFPTDSPPAWPRLPPFQKVSPEEVGLAMLRRWTLAAHGLDQPMSGRPDEVREEEVGLPALDGGRPSEGLTRPTSRTLP